MDSWNIQALGLNATLLCLALVWYSLAFLFVGYKNFIGVVVT